MTSETAVPSIDQHQRLLVVGLGNPGSRYVGTRHNAGFLVLDRLAHLWSIELKMKRRFSGLFGAGEVDGKQISLLKPATYMNLSGRSVVATIRYVPIDQGALVVIHDDVDLPLGRIRTKWSGSAGGHNGLRSIDSELGTTDYFRIRIGIGHGLDGTTSQHVLSPVQREDRDDFFRSVAGGAEATQMLLNTGLRSTQNAVHSTWYGTEAAE